MRKKGKSQLVYGIRAVMEALEAGKPIDKIMQQKGTEGPLLDDLKRKASRQNIYVQEVPREKLNRLVNGNHQGLIAFVSPVDFQPIEEVVPALFEKGKTPFILALDGITDVRNFGALVRTANGAGVDAIVVAARGSAAINEDAVKTSAGALFHVPICKVNNLYRSMRYLQQSGIKTVGITEKCDQNLYEFDLSVPVCMIMGSEDTGLSSSMLKLADELGKIPMLGKVESLNVSVAAGIALYEVVKQRMA